MSLRAIACATLLATAACTSASPPDSVPRAATACPTITDGQAFATTDQLSELLSAFNSFGLRSPASDAHEASLDWLGDELAAIPGMQVEWDEYDIDRWQPTPEAAGDVPGRDLAAAGGLEVGSREVPVVGAVPFSLPTTEGGAAGELVYLPTDVEITAENAAGKVVVREVPHSSIPYSVFPVIGHHLTDDLPTDGDYDRPYLRQIDPILIDAGAAGAAGLILTLDAPTEQLRGYWDPHTGTRFAVPAVYVGSDQVATLERLARDGATAAVTVRAQWDVASTRNLIATLPGQTRERIVVNTNTDSVTWIQENGTVGAIALARYFASLPIECRDRDVQFALTSNHLGFTADGTFRYGPQLDEDFDEGTVAFVMAPEHLGSREILPDGDDAGTLGFTGRGDLFAWSAPRESPMLVEASVAAVTRRGLDRTAVIEGVGAPTEDQVPAVCSQGGLGTNFHGLLIPTIAGISGPWSLWAPAFGADAVDVERMRDQLLAFSDVALALDDEPIDDIAGGYLSAREERAGGRATCDLTPPPAVAPRPR